jgi:hypothetical protein
MLDNAVTDRRNNGFSIGTAIGQVAEFFGVRPSVVKNHIYGLEERDGLRDHIYQRYLDHLSHEEQQLARRQAAIRARIQQAKR